MGTVGKRIELDVEVATEAWSSTYGIENSPEAVSHDVDEILCILPELDGGEAWRKALTETLFASDSGAKVVRVTLRDRPGIVANLGATLGMVQCGDEDCANGEHEAWFCDECGEEICQVWAQFDLRGHVVRVAEHYTESHDGRGNFEVPA